MKAIVRDQKTGFVLCYFLMNIDLGIDISGPYFPIMKSMTVSRKLL